MKQKLLYLFLFTVSLSFAQAPIAQFVNSTQQDYALLDSTVLLDESADGANATWSYTVSQVATNTDTNVAPTSGEQSTYPGTTEVLVITTNSMPPAESRLFIRDVANEISITGAAQEGLELNLTNNATLGTFPLSFGDSNADTVSGTFAGSVDGTNVNGTFTGSFDAEVDAHGTLDLNDFGLGAYNGNVTRIKTVLDISLVVAGIFNIGTVQQIGYYYYDDTDGSLVFRSSTNIFDIDFLGNVFMDTVALYEAQDRSTLGTNENVLTSSDIKLYPNPTTNVLNIQTADVNTIASVRVTDLNGRTVLQIDENINSINVSNLQSGLYLINIETSNGNITKRFIKK